MEFQNFLKFEELDSTSLPPCLKAYYDIKVKYPDFILLYQIGEFFETYFNDAINFSNATGAVLTKRKYSVGYVLLSGIPKSRLDNVISKLLDLGYKIAVAIEKKTDDKIERVVDKIYTKGTLLDLELLDSKENNYIASLYKKDGVYEICFADVSVGDVFISKGSYEEIKCELARVSPSELLIPKNSDVEKELYLSYKYEFLDENFYEQGEKPAYSGFINYTKHILKNYIPKFEKIKEYEIQKNLLIDFKTRKNLELTKNAYNNKKYGSLLWALDNCKTPMGKRLLASFISTPLYNPDEIKKRQEALLKFINNPETSEKLGVLLENTGDISRLSSRLSNGTITPLEFLTIKDSLKILKETEKIKNKLNIKLINEESLNKELLSDFHDIIEKTIKDDINSHKSGDFIKDGANPDLDILKIEYKKCENELDEYVLQLRAYTGITNIKPNKKGGSLWLEISSSKTPTGADFRLIQKLKTISKYTTDKLITLEEEIFSLEARISDCRKQIFENLKTYSKEITEDIRKYSKTLAMLDVFYSLYVVFKEKGFSFPVFQDAFEIKDAFHPAAKKILGKFEPLDLKFENSNFIMLTGTNGIGKSTLLKLIGITVVLAQAGFFVPSKEAKLPLVDKLFAILNLGDEIINKKSTHQAQMAEITRISENLTNRSVILLDEIGKNTSYKDGISLCYALIRYLSEETSAKTIFSTHYLNLKDLFEKSGSKISYFKISDENGKRTVTEGIAAESGGIIAAKNEKIPEKILKYADETAKFL